MHHCVCTNIWNIKSALLEIDCVTCNGRCIIKLVPIMATLCFAANLTSTRKRRPSLTSQRSNPTTSRWLTSTALDSTNSNCRIPSQKFHDPFICFKNWLSISIGALKKVSQLHISSCCSPWVEKKRA